MTWAQRLKRVFNIEVTTCVNCGGAARIVASVEEPHAIRAILDPACYSADCPKRAFEKDIAALANEVSGDTAKKSLEGIVQFHRERGYRGFHSAAELVELRGSQRSTIASYAADPIVLAEHSESADVTTALVDVGDGSKESDYAGKDVKGKIVLVAACAGQAGHTPTRRSTSPTECATLSRFAMRYRRS